jgi:hypothetical protein
VPWLQRLNGRAAMLGFVGIASAELSSQATAAEQLGDDIVGWGLLVITLTLASVFPKLVSGNSLEVGAARALGSRTSQPPPPGWCAAGCAWDAQAGCALRSASPTAARSLARRRCTRPPPATT